MSVPRTPAILFFHASPTVIMCNGEPYLDNPLAATPHTDTQVKVWDVVTGAVALDQTVSGRQANVRIENISPALAKGGLYRARMRYKNVDGWSDWSPNYIQRIHKALSFDPITVSGEPESGGEIPIRPSFPAAINLDRSFNESKVETGHTIRRPRHLKPRQWVQFQWKSISTSAKTTLETFLNARIKAAQGFTVTDSTHGSSAWFPRRGTVEVTQTTPGTWDVRVEADEIIPGGIFILGKSIIGSPDKIRKHAA